MDDESIKAGRLRALLDEDDVDVAPDPGPSRRRGRSQGHGRAVTVSTRKISQQTLRAGRLMYPPVDDPDRPKTRGECREELRPCPYVSCKFHLYLDVNPETGSIKINFPDLEPWELTTTCSLDVADQGGLTLDDVGKIMNLTRERIRQVEVRGLLKLKMGSPSPDEIGAALLRRPRQ